MYSIFLLLFLSVQYFLLFSAGFFKNAIKRGNETPVSIRPFSKSKKLSFHQTAAASRWTFTFPVAVQWTDALTKAIAILALKIYYKLCAMCKIILLKKYWPENSLGGKIFVWGGQKVLVGRWKELIQKPKKCQGFKTNYLGGHKNCPSKLRRRKTRNCKTNLQKMSPNSKSVKHRKYCETTIWANKGFIERKASL